MNEKSDLTVVLESSFDKTRAGGQGKIFDPSYDKVRFKLQDGERIDEEEFKRFQLIDEIERLDKAGKGVPYELKILKTNIPLVLTKWLRGKTLI